MNPLHFKNLMGVYQARVMRLGEKPDHGRAVAEGCHAKETTVCPKSNRKPGTAVKCGTDGIQVTLECFLSSPFDSSCIAPH